jgi:ABC-2 type transport system permease protein
MRYFIIYYSLVKFSIQRSLQFKLDFFLKIIMDCCFYGVHFLFFNVIMNHSEELAGWSRHQLQLLVAAISLMDALQMTFFSTNLWQFPTLVNTGHFDSYLLRPVSARFFTSLRSFQLDSFMNVLIAIGISIYIFSLAPEPVSWWRYMLFYIGVFCGTFIFYCHYFIALCGVFWFHKVKGFTSLSGTLSKFSEYPDSIYPSMLRKFFIFVVPYALISSFPSRLLFDAKPFHIFGLILLGCATIFALSQFIWRKGLFAYSSAS